MAPSSVLVVGASRGLGLALTQHFAKLIGGDNVYAAVRSSVKLDAMPKDVHVLSNIDVAQEDCGAKIVKGLNGAKVQIVIVVAGLLKSETFGKSSWKDQVAMYTVCSVAPVIIVEALATSESLASGAKIVLVTSEGGSLALRTEGEGGGMYGHHGSKAAANMAGRLLSFDLKPRGVPVAMVHPGFLKTEMTKGVGFDQYYESGGAVTPEEAAGPFAEFIENLDLNMSGKFWAPLGAKGIGNAIEVMGKDVADKPGPLELPW